MITAFILSPGLFVKGFLTGITLTMMLGPVTMIILRYGIQVNRKAGVWAATGTWISDLVFIAITFWATAFLAEWVERDNVRVGIFLVGGIALIVMGYILARSKSEYIDQDNRHTIASYTRAFLNGFFVNSISPFTLFFWIGAAILLRMQLHPPIWYYVGLMTSLAGGDFLKAWIAPKLTLWIKDQYVQKVQFMAGIFIILTGIYMITKGLLL
ncbi:MAG: LysE family transporter [Bacteroidota bacterium]|nr:LysE family transporter [Bacteroidota bacterium]